MGILQEAAILVGDYVTQPIRAKVVSAATGKNMHTEKWVDRKFIKKDDFKHCQKKVGWNLVAD